MKGFITIATGDDRYFQMAVNMLNSYRSATSAPLPFAILTDKENEYTKLFDDVIILENPTRTYYDKIYLLKNTPYDETIFIDADSLAYGDLNKLFDYFTNGAPVSCFGKTLPIESDEGWFNAESIGKYRDKVHFGAYIKSGVLYLRRGDEKSDIRQYLFELCQDISEHYYEYCKTSAFSKIADEPILALAFAVANCKPTEGMEYYSKFLPTTNRLQLNILNGKISYDTLFPKAHKECLLCHFGNANTDKPLYITEAAALNAYLSGNRLSAKSKLFIRNLKIFISSFHEA